MTRACGNCTLCCKLLAIAELEKPAGRWCPHCRIGEGCAIYAAKPPTCSAFNCAWLADENLGPEWKPDRAKFVLVGDAARNRAIVHVDPATPSAWKREPYRGELDRMMRAALAHGGQLFISVGVRTSILLPDGEHELGILSDDDVIELSARGDAWQARIVKAGA